MRIGEASRVGGVSARALRYYEDEGLIVPGRLGNGYRDYCRSTLDRVTVIRSLLEHGLPLRLVREVLPYLEGRAEGRTGPGANGLCPEFLDEVARYRDRLTERIDELDTRRSAVDAFLREARPPGGDRA